MKRFFLLLTCLFTFAGLAYGQVTKVKGTVVFEDDGTPVIGASVLVKDAPGIGTTTDIDGKFVLSGIPKDAKMLVVSFIGMQSEEVAIRPEITVRMKPSTELLEEAVVTIAYGAAKKSSLTGAVASVSAEKIENRITSDVTSALEGTVAGVQVNSTYGAPGESPTIRIRGIGTVNGDASPLYVVDGVPYDGDSAELNPADIESVSVLKDAASAALYGNRASNGVVLITTKQGTPNEKVQMRLDIRQGIYARGQKEYDVLTPDEWMEAEWLNMKNQYIGNGYDATAAGVYASNYLILDRVKHNIYNADDDKLFTSQGKLAEGVKIRDGYLDDLDWFKEAYRIGWRQEYNFRGQGGADKSDYYFSLGYLDEQGYVVNADYSRLTARAVVNTKPFKWIKTGLNLYGSYLNTNHSDGSDESYTNYTYVCRMVTPVYPVHIHDLETGEYVLDANGNKQYNIGYFTDKDGYVQNTRLQFEDRNVIWENIVNSNNSKRIILQGTAYVDLYWKDFTFTVKANLNLRDNTQKRYYSSLLGANRGIGAATRTENAYTKLTFQQQLRWAHQFGSHTVSALVAHETYDYNRDYSYGKKNNEIYPDVQSLVNFTEIEALTSYNVLYRTESYLGRVRYAYQDKYNLEGSFRRDGSSRFADGARWGNFWSIGANWVVTREKFMRKVKWINSLKIRADYGEVGNDAAAGYFSGYNLYTISQNANEPALYFSQIGNPDLKWETGQSWGVGFEARLFKRWNLNVEYFDRVNKDLLFKVYNPLSAGATSTSATESVIVKNLGDVDNRGLEIETDVDVIKHRKWKLNIGANATIMKNTVTHLPKGNEDGIINYVGGRAIQRIQEGHPLYSYYTYDWVGIDQMNGRSLYRPNLADYCITDNKAADGEVLYGTPVYDDYGNVTNLFPKTYTIINGEPYCYHYAYAARSYKYDAHPRIFGSVTASLSYKQWTLSSLFTYSLGGYTYDAAYQSLMGNSSISMHQFHRDLKEKAWAGIPDGMTEDSPDRIAVSGVTPLNSSYYTGNSNANSTHWLTPSDYFIIKNAKLSYALSKKAIRKLNGVRGVNCSITGENLLTFSARRGMNPQQSLTGYHGHVFVAPRIVTLDLSIKF